MEHIITRHIMSHLGKNNVLSNAQHGFGSNRSTETQLLAAVHDFATTLNNHKQVDAILLDFTKAFDRVPHQRLLYKLHHYGIRGQIHQCIQAFLSNCTQSVIIDGQQSKPSSVLSGVPRVRSLVQYYFYAISMI